MSYQTSPKGSQGEFCMVITICFERSTRVHFFDLGWLWDSTLGPLDRLFDVFFSSLKKVKLFFFHRALWSVASATQRGKGGNWEASRSLGCLGSSRSLGGPFTIVKMQSKRRERPFRRRVAKVGVTKYRILHGSSADAQPAQTRMTYSPAVTHAAKNPTAKAVWVKNMRWRSQLSRKMPLHC